MNFERQKICLQCVFLTDRSLPYVTFLERLPAKWGNFMSLIRFAVITSFAVIGLSSCASTPDPEKICTAEWIGKRSDRAISRIESRAKPALTKLGKAAQKWARGDKPNAFQLLSLNSSVNSLTRELESGQALKDLKTVSTTCNDPKIVTQALTKVMRDNGLNEQMINFIQTLPKYKSLIEQNLTTGPVTQYKASPPLVMQN